MSTQRICVIHPICLPDSLHPHPLPAAVWCCIFVPLQSELEDGVFIWCAEGSTHNSSSSSHPSHAGGLNSSSRSSSGGISSPRAALSPRAAAAAAVGTSAAFSGSNGSSDSNGHFVLDCLLPLEDTVASLAWLDTGGLPPLLAVGVASGGVEVYSRDRR